MKEIGLECEEVGVIRALRYDELGRFGKFRVFMSEILYEKSFRFIYTRVCD